MESAEQLQIVLTDLAAIASEDQMNEILDIFENLDQKNQDLEQKLSESTLLNNELMKRNKEQEQTNKEQEKSLLEKSNEIVRLRGKIATLNKSDLELKRARELNEQNRKSLEEIEKEKQNNQEQERRNQNTLTNIQDQREANLKAKAELKEAQDAFKEEQKHNQEIIEIKSDKQAKEKYKDKMQQVGAWFWIWGSYSFIITGFLAIISPLWAHIVGLLDIPAKFIEWFVDLPDISQPFADKKEFYITALGHGITALLLVILLIGLGILIWGISDRITFSVVMFGFLIAIFASYRLPADTLSSVLPWLFFIYAAYMGIRYYLGNKKTGGYNEYRREYSQWENITGLPAFRWDIEEKEKDRA